MCICVCVGGGGFALVTWCWDGGAESHISLPRNEQTEFNLVSAM